MRDNTAHMRFRVGPYVYTLHVDPGPIMFAGHACDALAETDGRRIRLSADVPAADRHRLLIHELAHCWTFHVPMPRTEEELADLTATIADAARIDLEDQGGIGALLRLAPPTDGGGDHA